MCIICVQLQQDKLTAREARYNFYEMIEEIGQDHHKEIARKSDEKWEEEEKNRFNYESYSED